MKDYVKEYFDRHAHEWVEAAYVGDVKFPVGPERVRLAIEGVAPALRKGGRIVDLGCGGGQLCVHAARLGWAAVGVDVAPGMIEQARVAAEGLELEWVVAEYDESGLPDAAFDAVTALGLVEYLDDDEGLFAEAARLLHANDYTAEDLAGEAPRLLDELRDELAKTGEDELHALALSIADWGDELRTAVEADRAQPSPELLDHPRAFQRRRRQHSPREVEEVAERHGFRHVETLALHPHPLPPALEALAPRTYNALALAWQRPLERSPAGLAFCTAFVGVFELT